MFKFGSATGINFNSTAIRQVLCMNFRTISFQKVFPWPHPFIFKDFPVSFRQTGIYDVSKPLSHILRK
jgi:hypothetical protein